MWIGGVRRGWEGAFLTAALLLGSLAGCGLGDPQPYAEAQVAPSEVTREVAQVLRKRVRAVRKGRIAPFLDGLVDDPVLRRNQRDYFNSLQQLPLARYGYALSDDGVEVGDRQVTATLAVVTKLAGFDTAPVRTPVRMTLVREQDGVLRISAARDEAYERERGTVPQPWDSTPVEVHHGIGVLGVFDRDSARHAAAIVREVEEAMTQVAARVPYDWSRRVVVYALSDTSFLTSLPNLPGDDPEQLDGVAFPVPVRPGSDTYAGTRFLLHPRIFERPSARRARLIRHELVHVALGQKDDRVPTWLSEGLAEYVAARPLAPEDRMIAQGAVTAARRGLDQLPSDATFNGVDSGANYGIAWYACDYIARVYGESVLWHLFDVMRADGGVDSDDQDGVLLDVLGVDAPTLARATGDRIARTFG